MAARPWNGLPLRRRALSAFIPPSAKQGITNCCAIIDARAAPKPALHGWLCVRNMGETKPRSAPLRCPFIPSAKLWTGTVRTPRPGCAWVPSASSSCIRAVTIKWPFALTKAHAWRAKARRSGRPRPSWRKTTNRGGICLAVGSAASMPHRSGWRRSSVNSANANGRAQGRPLAARRDQAAAESPLTFAQKSVMAPS